MQGLWLAFMIGKNLDLQEAVIKLALQDSRPVPRQSEQSRMLAA